MITIAICDDDIESVHLTVQLLEQYKKLNPQLQLRYSCFTKADDLLDSAAASTFDMYFLDVIMPQMNGIELARILRSLGSHGSIIYMTASQDFALEAFQVRAYSYLLKPLDQKELFPLLDEFVEQLPHSKNVTISLPDGGFCCVPLQKLMYVEHERHICLYHLLSGEAVRSKTIRVSFSHAMEALSQDFRFLMPHQSFMINMQHVYQMNSSEFIMTDRTIIPISRHRSAAIKSRYLEYLSSQNI